MSITIQHIADHVGVSKQAVSYALNGKAGQVSEATRERIQAAAKALGYQPNWRARSFARRRSQIIGLVYGRPAEYVERSQVVSALVERLAALDYELLMIPAMGAMTQWSHKLRDGRVDGVLVTHPMPLGLDEFVAQHRLPAVFMNLRSDLPVPQVYFDDADGARRLVRHLLELGHRRIVYFSAPMRHGEHYSSFERRDAYRATMAEAGLTAQAAVVESEYDAFAERFVQTPAGDRPTAVVAYNEYNAIRVMRELWYRGVRVPDDLSIAGFDDTPIGRDTIPPLTSVALPARELVPRCIDLLMSQLDHDEDTSRVQVDRICLPESLVVRQSTSPPPA